MNLTEAVHGRVSRLGNLDVLKMLQTAINTIKITVGGEIDRWQGVGVVVVAI